MMYWAIKHKPSNGYIPQLTTKKRCATTLEIDITSPPRLFLSHSSAAKALTVWLSGMLGKHYSQEGEVRGIEVVTIMPKRKREEMEIVLIHCYEEIDE